MFANPKRIKKRCPASDKCNNLGFVVTDMKSPKSTTKKVCLRNLQDFHVTDETVTGRDENAKKKFVIGNATSAKQTGRKKQTEKGDGHCSSNQEKGALMIQLKKRKKESGDSYGSNTIRGFAISDLISKPCTNIVDYASSEEETQNEKRNTSKLAVKMVDDKTGCAPSKETEVSPYNFKTRGIVNDSGNSSMKHESNYKPKSMCNTSSKQENPLQIGAKSKLLKQKYLLSVLKSPSFKDPVNVTVGFHQSKHTAEEEQKQLKSSFDPVNVTVGFCQSKQSSEEEQKPLKSFDPVNVTVGFRQSKHGTGEEQKPLKPLLEEAFPERIDLLRERKIHKYSCHKGPLPKIGISNIFRSGAKCLEQKDDCASKITLGTFKSVLETKPVHNNSKLFLKTKTMKDSCKMSIKTKSIQESCKLFAKMKGMKDSCKFSPETKAVQEVLKDANVSFNAKSDIETKCWSSPSSPLVFKLSYSQDELTKTKYNPGFIDTHCHLDFLFTKDKHTGTYAKYQATRHGQDVFPVSYEGCVAVFCQPWTFRMISWWENFLAELNVWATFGCHPHYCNSFGAEEENYLKHALQQPKTVALGEIGLDYSFKNNHSKDLQQIVFRRQLELALEYKKPIVIHCRDASRDCITILKEMIPRDHMIHRHCFTGDWEEAEEWLGTFSNLYIGITPLITYRYTGRSYGIRDTARRMPLNRLLLETDAPYFRPHCYQGNSQWSNPGMAIHVAAQVALLTGRNIQEILEFARKNTKAVYGI